MYVKYMYAFEWLTVSIFNDYYFMFMTFDFNGFLFDNNSFLKYSFEIHTNLEHMRLLLLDIHRFRHCKYKMLN